MSEFMRMYLVSWLFWSGLSVGCLALLMMHHLVSGRWGFPMQRFLEAGAATLPWMALLFLPIVIRMGDIYPWLDQGLVSASPLLRHKSAYLNGPFFIGRSALYFAVWIALAAYLRRFSLEQERSGAPSRVYALQALSGGGLVILTLTVTFASVDWMMSLEPRWNSTVYGLQVLMGHGLAALAFLCLAATSSLAPLLTQERFHELGNLLLAFVMLWAYMAFSQLIIIWAGNKPEEISWYLHRIEGNWQWVGLCVFALHFFLPFLALLFRGVKRNAGALAAVAGALLGMRFVVLIWMILPAFPTQTWRTWVGVLVWPALGVLWLALFSRAAAQAPLLPADPRMEVFDRG